MPKRKPPKHRRVINAETIKANQNVPAVTVIPPGDARMLQELNKGKDPEKAAKAAGMSMSPAAAESHAGYLIERYGQVVINALEEHGATVSKLAQRLSEGLDAEKPLVVKGVVRKYPDHLARQRAINTMLDILPGARAPKQMEVETRSLEAVIMKIQVEDGDDDGW